MRKTYGSNNPKAIEAVYRDFTGRRFAIIKALTTDVEEFIKQCDPGKKNLSLYGYYNKTWQVCAPLNPVPPELPEPVTGINYSRDGLGREQWLTVIASHSDSWLLSVAFFYASRFHFDKESRMRLFARINSHPTIYQIVVSKQKDKILNSNRKRSPRAPRLLPQTEVRVSRWRDRAAKTKESEKVVDNEVYDEFEDAVCGICKNNFIDDGFWIWCDECERWFHGACVSITPDIAENIKVYSCPHCTRKKPRVV